MHVDKPGRACEEKQNGGWKRSFPCDPHSGTVSNALATSVAYFTNWLCTNVTYRGGIRVLPSVRVSYEGAPKHYGGMKGQIYESPVVNRTSTFV